MEPLTKLIRRFSKRMKRCNVWLVCALWLVAFLMVGCDGQQSGFSGLEMGLGNLARLSYAQTRSVSPENFTGEKGKGGMATEGTGARAARELGQTWKVSPSVSINPNLLLNARRGVFSLAGRVSTLGSTPWRSASIPRAVSTVIG